jgi:hypothetical protein
MRHATLGCRVMGPSGSEDHRTEPSRTRRLVTPAPYIECHQLQASVGQYGVFNGKRWRAEIYPMVRDRILASV